MEYFRIFIENKSNAKIKTLTIKHEERNREEREHVAPKIIYSAYWGNSRVSGKKRDRKLARFGKIQVFHCGRKMSGRTIRLRSRPDDHSWVNQRSRLHMQQESSVTGRQTDGKRGTESGKAKEKEKERSVKRGRARGKEAVSRACFKSDSSVRADHWLLLINNKCIPE